MYLSTSNTPHLTSGTNMVNNNRPVWDYWTASNPDAFFPMMEYNIKSPRTGIKYMDRSFIKLQKVSLTYNATKLVNPWGINNMKLTLSADNLFIYAPHWQGLDPETNQGLTIDAVPSIRTYLFSLKFNF